MSMLRKIVPFVMTAALVASCGVPSGEDTFEQIADADVPLNLASPSTTTTTTTSTVPEVLPETTTTVTDVLPEPETEPVRLYFLARDELIETRRSIETGFAPFQLIDLLAAGPDPETNPGLETAVPEGLVRSIDVVAGTATVDLVESVYDRVVRSEQLPLFAQIVLTLTDSASRFGIVTFTIDGSPTIVPVPDNLFRRTVTFDSYSRLIVNAVVNSPVTTSTVPETTVPETTVPETTVPDSADDAEPTEAVADEITGATTAAATSTSVPVDIEPTTTGAEAGDTAATTAAPPTTTAG